MSLKDWFAAPATATLATPATVSPLRQGSVATVATVAVANDDEVGSDDDSEATRRRARALAALDADPALQIAVVAEPGDPAHITVAVRGVAVGDMEIAAHYYDGFALTKVINKYGQYNGRE